MANMNRVDWWVDNMVKESTDARNAFRAGVETVGLAHVGTVVEAIADLLGELERPEAEQLALSLRNAIYDISETWDMESEPLGPSTEPPTPSTQTTLEATKEH